MTLGGQVLTAFVFSLVMILIAALIVFLSRSFVISAEWIANATRDGNAAPDPFALKGVVTVMGTLFGLGAGVAWLESRGGWQASGPVVKRALRYIVGFVGILVFYVGLDLIFPDGDSLVPLVFRYVRYALVGAWMSAGAPWVFAKLQLTDKPNL
jgi:hypothetical protein